ncbi:MAG: hypothetical protein ACI8UO_003967 [Verrucomicrobiales bacterium]|jgi:hypothetical protein
MLVEMVWRMMRRQPDYHALKKWAHVRYDANRNEEACRIERGAAAAYFA